MTGYQLPLDGMFTCSGEITKYKLCLANYNWTSNISVTLVRFREVLIQNQAVASTGVSHVQLVVTSDSPARRGFLGVLRKKIHNAKLTFGCNDFLGCTAPSRLANVVTNDNIFMRVPFPISAFKIVPPVGSLSVQEILAIHSYTGISWSFFVMRPLLVIFFRHYHAVV